MGAPLDGIRVIEVANWLAAPAAAALLADLGADVIKVEPPGGDVLRHFDVKSMGYTRYDFPGNCTFELDNRGKRSVTVALDRPGGPELVHRLLRDADVLVLNLTPQRRAKYRLTEQDVRAHNPRLVYASLTGYGTVGPDAERPGFDYAAFWARSGIMGSLGQPGGLPVMNRGGQGDHTTALNLLAAVLAALRQRDRTGEGQSVEVTLLGTGMWTVAGDFSAVLLTGEQPPRHDLAEPSNPIWNTYETRDHRHVLLVMPHSDPYWPRFCQMIGEPQWVDDARYADAPGRRAHSRALTEAIAAHFRADDLAAWSARLDQAGMVWAPVLDFVEVAADPQPRAIGLIAELEHPEYGRYQTLAAPFELRGAGVRPRGPAPKAGEHTEQVLRELGCSDDEVAAWRAAAVLG